ncbi:hypothetical protein [Lentzea californiensis]|uniref:hypothetical protein n=1 Tax=Lentzea californiensis TaxID=438851 RepID=UPI002165AC89|nr:hypothetical protein [Lentzea californiensis]MCR3750261.1 hypothetical protein [Lentzea californiensis]
MSAGGMVLAPVVLPAVAAGAVVLVGAVVIAAGAVLVVRAANAAIEGGVRAVAEAGERTADEVAAIEARSEDTLRWQAAAADVVAVNARIRLLHERVVAAGISMIVPHPLRLTSSKSPAELGRMAAEAQAAVALAQAELDRRLPRPRLELFASQARSESADKTLDAYEDVLRARYAAVAAPAPTVSPDEVHRVLALLDPDAGDDERIEVLATAARVARAQGDGDVYFRQLRMQVTDEINPRVARRRLAATWLQALEEGPLPDALAEASITPPPSVGDAVEALRKVVSGDEDLTRERRDEAVQAMAWMEEKADQVLTLRVTQHCLQEQGYEVIGTFDTRNAVGLKVAKPEWGGQHNGTVWVDHKRTVHSRLQRPAGAIGDAARARDGERCEEFADDLEQVGKQVSDNGANITVRMNRGMPVGQEARYVEEPAQENGKLIERQVKRNS